MTMLVQIPTSCEKKVLIECDFKISSKCKLQYTKVYKNVLKGRENNNGKDRCCYCFNTITKRGENNFNFKYLKNESFFKDIDSELKAYLLGWVAGDGSLKKRSLQLSVHKKDKEIIYLFQRSITPDGPIYERDYDNTINIIINSIVLVNDLCKQLNVRIGKKSDKISLPNLSDELLIHFIRGLIDSDGHIGKINTSIRRPPNCSYCSTSSLIKDQIIEFCKSKNIKYYQSKFSLHWQGAYALVFMKMIYENANFFLKRKYDLYLEWSTWVPYRGTLNFPPSYKKKKENNDKILYS